MWSTIALLLQAIVCASDAADTSGGPGEITPTSIVGGHTIDPNFKYPWMASLREDNSHFCGGVLLNPTTLLTAAHCSQFTSTEGLTVTVHRNDLRKTVAQEQGALFTVKSIKAHPKYNDEIMSNDAAIWKLELIEGTVPPLPKFSFDTGAKSKAGTSLTIAGWGGTSSRGLSNILLEVDVPVSTDAACKKAYPDVSPTSICAGFEQGGKDTCQGDSGGPIFSYTSSVVTLVGITSYGDGCAQEGIPGVYTRLASSSVAGFVKSNSRR